MSQRTTPRKPRLRLLKVIVQPVFILDDGENVSEKVAEPFIVTSADWRAFADADGLFDAGIKKLQDDS